MTCIAACNKDNSKPVDPVDPVVYTMTGTEWMMDVVAKVPLIGDTIDRKEPIIDTVIVHFMSIGLAFETDSTLTLKTYTYDFDIGAVDFEHPDSEEPGIYEYTHPNIYIYEDPNAVYAELPETNGDIVPPTSDEPVPPTEGYEFVMHLQFEADSDGNDDSLLRFVNFRELFTSMGAEELLENVVSDPVFRKVTSAG